MSDVVFSAPSGVRAVVVDDHVVSEGRRSTTVQSEGLFPATQASAVPVLDRTGYRVDRKWPPRGAHTEGAGLL
jgi:hypothetical protein